MVADLPYTKVFFDDEPEAVEIAMEFRLTHRGRLRAESCQDRATPGPYGRANDKHELRKLFHPQLRELWKQHPDLRT